jgi:hypothetical protein
VDRSETKGGGGRDAQESVSHSSLLTLLDPRVLLLTDVVSASSSIVAGGREVQNEHAIKVIRRIQDKLHGRDFKATVVLPVDAQVEKLIEQATSVINLCQCFIGWCAFVSNVSLLPPSHCFLRRVLTKSLACLLVVRKGCAGHIDGEGEGNGCVEEPVEERGEEGRGTMRISAL